MVKCIRTLSIVAMVLTVSALGAVDTAWTAAADFQ
jgi:hypothetical protein